MSVSPSVCLSRRSPAAAAVDDVRPGPGFEKIDRSAVVDGVRFSDSPDFRKRCAQKDEVGLRPMGPMHPMSVVSINLLLYSYLTSGYQNVSLISVSYTHLTLPTKRIV